MTENYYSFKQTAQFIQRHLIWFIAGGIILGIAIGYGPQSLSSFFAMFGDLFIGALKAVAPILVFVLVLSAIANRATGKNTKMGSVITLYLMGTFFAALTAVIASFLFPVDLLLNVPKESVSPPTDIVHVLKDLLFKIIENPVSALLKGNYIGILAWASLLGLFIHNGSESTKALCHDVAHAVSEIVKLVILFAPLGICGLVAATVADTGLSKLLSYGHLLFVLLGSMAFVALVINPLLVFWKTKKNPYPLVFTCLAESGFTAFFTRSSAANIPVNMALCERLQLDEDIYSVSIPLGATINMAGAAITITVLTLATVHHLGIQIDLFSALLLSVVAALSACGASGVAGGSLLLIPLACNLFGIDNDIAIQVVATGFIIGVIQDSAETALNSSTDVLFTAAVCHQK